MPRSPTWRPTSSTNPPSGELGLSGVGFLPHLSPTHSPSPGSPGLFYGLVPPSRCLRAARKARRAGGLVDEVNARVHRRQGGVVILLQLAARQPGDAAALSLQAIEQHLLVLQARDERSAPVTSHSFSASEQPCVACRANNRIPACQLHLPSSCSNSRSCGSMSGFTTRTPRQLKPLWRSSVSSRRAPPSAETLSTRASQLAN